MFLSKKTRIVIAILSIIVIILTFPTSIGILGFVFHWIELADTGVSQFTQEEAVFCGVMGGGHLILIIVLIFIAEYLKRGYQLKYLFLGAAFHRQADPRLKDLKPVHRKSLLKRMKCIYRKTGRVYAQVAPAVQEDRYLNGISDCDFAAASDSERFGYLLYELSNACASGAGYEGFYRMVFLYHPEITTEEVLRVFETGSYLGVSLPLSDGLLASLRAASLKFEELLLTEDGSGEYLRITGEFEDSFKADLYLFEEELVRLRNVIVAMEKLDAFQRGNDVKTDNGNPTVVYAKDRHHRAVITEDPETHAFRVYRYTFLVDYWQLSGELSFYDTKERAVKDVTEEFEKKY